MTSKTRSVAVILVSIGIIGLGIFVGFRNSAPSAALGVKSQSLDGQIATLKAQIVAGTQDSRAYIGLSEAYLQKIRETADATYYDKIDTLMAEAAKLDPTNGDVPATLSSVANGRHQFAQSLDLANKAIAINPNRAAYYGLAGDADIELGRYSDAVAEFQKMVDMLPNFASLSRIGYIRELYGDIPGAKAALNSAIESGSSFNENIAYAYVELGKLDIHTSLDQAKTDFENALAAYPNYATANEGLGRVAFFQHDYATAEADYTAAYNTLGTAVFAIDLGDLYAAEGNATTSAQYLTLAKIAFSTSAQSGVDTDLEESVFLSDHNLDLPDALAMAKRAYVDRPNIYAADYLAWALYKNGMGDQSLQYAPKALRLGETDPLILYHLGVIAQAVGQDALAKKYLTESQAANKYFSIQHTPEEQALLKTL